MIGWYFATLHTDTINMLNFRESILKFNCLRLNGAMTESLIKFMKIVCGAAEGHEN